MSGRRWLSALAISVALLAGAALRFLASAPPGATVVAYFPDAEGRYLIPVTRSVRESTPGAALSELLAGPNQESPLAPVLAPGVRAELAQQGGEWTVTAETDLAPLAREAIARTILSVPAVQAVTVGDRRWTSADFSPAGGQALIFYPYRGMPVPVLRALPAGSSDANAMEAALNAYLSGPPPPGLLGPPSGVGLAGVSVKGDVAHVRLNFSPELTAAVLAGAWNFSPYYLSVIYTLTEFPGIRRVQFDFPGMTAAALRQCRTPLSVPLPRPDPEGGAAR